MSEPGPDRRLPPEGAVCADHPQREALATCPRCGGHACIACWHGAVDRCQGCLIRDPAAAGPQVPWEDRERGLPGRLFGTLGSAFRPMRSAPGFAREPLLPAAVFALITAVPLAALRGVIPFTHHVQFGSAFAVSVPPGVDAGAVALDVARAMGISLLMYGAYFAALILPYASLARAYGRSPQRRSGARMMLYRAWLLPMSLFGLPIWLAGWALPEGAGWGLAVAAAVEILPLVLLFISMRATARLAHGVGPFASLLVVLVPLALMILTQRIFEPVLAPWIPETTQRVMAGPGGDDG